MFFFITASDRFLKHIRGRHKSILGYAEALCKTTTASTLRAELNLGFDVFSEDTAKKYGQLLEKKWTTVSRLEQKVN